MPRIVTDPAYLATVEHMAAGELADQCAVTVDQWDHLADPLAAVGAIAAALDRLYPTDAAFCG